MQLYNVGTFYELLNAIHIKMSLFPEEKADIILMDATDFSKQAAELKKSGIFEDVFEEKGAWAIDRAIRLGADQERRPLIKDFVQQDHPFTRKRYSDYFLGAQTPYFKLVYYALCGKGIYPCTHLFEDGIYTYVLDFAADCGIDGFKHEKYGRRDIRKNLGSIYAYGDASMYFGSDSLQYVQIPPLTANPALLQEEKELFSKVWGEYSLPQEKYIFLEEGMFQDHLNAADTVMLEDIAKIVGKENIIVKRHPRCQHDRFTERGFKVLTDSRFPWEITLLNEDARHHVLISLSSTATTTGKTVLGKNIPAVQLYAMRPFGEAGPHCAQKNFEDYAKSLYAYMNQGGRCLFVPKSMDELKEAILFIEGSFTDAD